MSLTPAEGGGNVGQDRLDRVRVVLDAELVGDGEQQGVGGGEIDLRDARFTERAVTIHIVAILGGCEVIVPEDATVRVTGVGILGAFEHSDSGGGTADGPVITIDGLALLGGVDVKRKPTTEAAREARQLRHEARRQRHEIHRESRDRRRAGELE